MMNFERRSMLLAAFLMDGLCEQLKPLLENTLKVSCAYNINLKGINEDALVIIELVPNPEFGKPPCHFIEPVIVIPKRFTGEHLQLSFCKKVYDNEETRRILRTSIETFRNSGLQLDTFLLCVR